MTTKPLLLTIMLALPFGARADYTYENLVGRPAQTPSNGTVVLAGSSGPYQIVEPTQADESHIASTSYVKGAYNEVIAAVNSLDHLKQTYLFNSDSGVHMDNEVFDANSFVPYVAGDAEEPDDSELNLVSMAAVKAGILSQRVKIYTTWDDDRDSATTQVALETVVPED